MWRRDKIIYPKPPLQSRPLLERAISPAERAYRRVDGDICPFVSEKIVLILTECSVIGQPHDIARRAAVEFSICGGRHRAEPSAMIAILRRLTAASWVWPPSRRGIGC